MPDTILVLAQGFEDIEAITVSDILRRADISVVTVGIGGREITGARGTVVTTDTVIETITTPSDACICPGGLPGAKNLAHSKEVSTLIHMHHDSGKCIAAICAAPALVLAPLGILNHKKATCYPSMETAFTPQTTYVTDPVVVDGNVITSRGPATALPFARALVTFLAGKEKADSIAQDVLMQEVYTQY